MEWQPATEFVDREKRRVVRRWIVWPSAETGVVRVGNPRGDVLRIVGLNVGTGCATAPKGQKRVLWIVEICVGTWSAVGAKRQSDVQSIVEPVRCCVEIKHATGTKPRVIVPRIVGAAVGMGFAVIITQRTRTTARPIAAKGAGTGSVGLAKPRAIARGTAATLSGVGTDVARPARARPTVLLIVVRPVGMACVTGRSRRSIARTTARCCVAMACATEPSRRRVHAQSIVVCAATIYVMVWKIPVCARWIVGPLVETVVAPFRKIAVPVHRTVEWFVGTECAPGLRKTRRTVVRIAARIVEMGCVNRLKNCCIVSTIVGTSVGTGFVTYMSCVHVVPIVSSIPATAIVSVAKV